MAQASRRGNCELTKRFGVARISQKNSDFEFTKYIAHNSMSIKVLMIHGTFASDATWVDATSLVSERIKTELAMNVLIEPFRWSGHNTFAARAQAASNLVRIIENDAPDTRYILIAHSHGGSVVHYDLAPENRTP